MGNHIPRLSRCYVDRYEIYCELHLIELREKGERIIVNAVITNYIQTVFVCVCVSMSMSINQCQFEMNRHNESHKLKWLNVE